jgi:TatD DNase family protein
VSRLVDSHCHLDLIDPSLARVDALLADAAAVGVGHFLCVSVSLANAPVVRGLAARYDNVSASVGVHPNHVDQAEPQVAALAELAADPLIVAVGETGLDYHYGADHIALQQTRFRTHIRAAREVCKPLIVHMRDATNDTLGILAEERAGEVGGVMHCFTEDWPTAQRALDLGFHISFSGIVTFKSAEPIREAARQVPAERLLVETDAPYLAPVPHRGKQNQPAYVRQVADCVAALRGVAPVDLDAQVGRNFFALFRTARAPRSIPGQTAASP